MKFGFNGDRSAILGWVDQINNQTRFQGAKTTLYDALLDSVKALEPQQDGDSIYVITDGIDNVSQADLREKLKQELLKSGVRLFVFQLSEQMLSEEREGSAIMDIANESGGFVFGVTAESGSLRNSSFAINTQVRERIKAETALLNLQLGGFYLINLGALRGFDGAHVSLAIVDDRGKQRKGLVVTFPHRLFGCSSPQAN